MLVEEDTYIHLFGGWCEVCLLGTYIHTTVSGLVSGMYVSGGRYIQTEDIYTPPFGGGSVVCMLLDEDTYIPPFGMRCEVCLLGTYIHTSVWGL